MVLLKVVIAVAIYVVTAEMQGSLVLLYIFFFIVTPLVGHSVAYVDMSH